LRINRQTRRHTERERHVDWQ